MGTDVAGLGNALVDALVRVPDDALLARFGLTRGQMHPVEHGRWQEIYEANRTLLESADWLELGMELNLPVIEPSSPVQAAASAEAGDEQRRKKSKVD